ncbi:MAG: flap endonuclease, partial [Myxococcales bacterium]
MSSRLLLLDTASLYFRAFYGVPDSIKAADGRPVNAVRGMLDFLATLQDRYEPEAVVAAWDDDWRPAWRVELLDTYKTHRVADPEAGIEETPDLLAHQVPLIAEALTLAGATVVGAPEAEADDVIGTLVHRWETGIDVVTGDRDLFQLVDDARDVRILYTARGV